MKIRNLSSRSSWDSLNSEFEMIASNPSCKHELPLGQCSFCKEAPFGIYEIGFKTKYGHAFHNWQECPLIEEGQKFAVSRGGEATEVVNVSWSSALQDLQPCEWCCALYYTKGEFNEECLVIVNDKPVSGKILKSRYVTTRAREFQVYFPESGEIWFFPGDKVKIL